MTTQKMQRRDVEGIHFLKLQGTYAERAGGHGALLKDEIHDGALPVLAKKNQWMIRRGPGLVQLKPVQDAMVLAYEKFLLPWLSRQTPDEQKGMVKALSEASGIPEKVFIASLFQADGLMLLSRVSVMKTLLRHLPAGGLPGCTSAVVGPEWTKTGRVMHARNMDYPIVGSWERHPVVMFAEPEEKGEIPHVSVTTAGVHTGGLTAMNREGITVCAHAHFARGVSLSGLPIFTIGEQVARHARTLSEAVDICKKFRRTANWALVVSSAKDQDGAVIEMTPDKTRVHPSSAGLTVHSNYFRTPELQATEALLSGGVCDDLTGRVCRMRQVLEPMKGSLEAGDLARALGDHVDHSTGEERVFGNTVSVVTTIKSVVFDPGAQKLWVASRKESPVCLGDYLEVDVENFWKQPEGTPLPKVAGYKPENPRLLEGVRHYRSAYQHWHIQNDAPDFAENALAAIHRAISAYPEDGYVWIQGGLVAFRLRQWDEARRLLEGAVGKSLSAHITQVRDLFLARCYDLSGERAKAKELYACHQNSEEPKIRKAFRKGLKRAYRRGQVGELVLDLQFPDVIQY